MAKLPTGAVVLVAVAAAGYLGYRKIAAQQQAEQDLWAEATDTVAPPDLR